MTEFVVWTIWKCVLTHTAGMLQKYSWYINSLQNVIWTQEEKGLIALNKRYHHPFQMFYSRETETTQVKCTGVLWCYQGHNPDSCHLWFMQVLPRLFTYSPQLKTLSINIAQLWPVNSSNIKSCLVVAITEKEKKCLPRGTDETVVSNLSPIKKKIKPRSQ